MNKKLPDWQIFTFDEVDSTNDVIKNYCTQSGKPVVVRALKQVAGRGRRGRKWISQKGNLFFSFAWEIDLRDLGMLVLISSLSLWQTLHLLNPRLKIEIKWPNDILIDGKKVSGMLLEKGPENFMIAGIGVNVSQRPPESDVMYPTTSLSESGVDISADDLMEKYLIKLSNNFALWQQGHINDLRQEWLDAVKGVGKTIEVHQENVVIRGIFKGIDENAHLLLENEKGICQIRAWDIFYIESK